MRESIKIKTDDYNFKFRVSGLIIKDNKDLLDKLSNGIEDTDNGKVCFIEEAYKEVKKILTN